MRGVGSPCKPYDTPERGILDPRRPGTRAPMALPTAFPNPKLSPSEDVVRSIAPRFSAALTFAALSALASPAHALLGDTISCRDGDIYRCSARTAVVGTGTEFTFSNFSFSYGFDFDATGLTITVLAAPSRPTFSDTLLFQNLNMPFSSVSFESSSIPGVDASSPLIDADGMAVLIADGTPSVGQSARFNLMPTPAIPEPGSYALMAGGLALLGWLGRGRRRQGVVAG